MNDAQPTWLTEKCPRWCDGNHSGQKFVIDRRHQSELATVPAIVRHANNSVSENEPQEEAAPDEVLIVAHRKIDSDETWIAIAAEHTSIEVSAETAYRIAAALRGRLPSIGTDD